MSWVVSCLRTVFWVEVVVADGCADQPVVKPVRVISPSVGDWRSSDRMRTVMESGARERSVR